MEYEGGLNGYVKMYRKILDWEWFKDAKTLQLFVCLLALSSFKDSKWQGKEIKKGELICSVGSLSKYTGLSAQSVRTSLNKLKSTNEITIKTTNKYTVVSIVKYSIYQSNDEELTNKTTSELTNEQQTTNKQTTNNQQHRKNVKNDKNVNNIHYAENVSMTEIEYNKVVEQYGKSITDNKIIDLSLWKLSKGKQTKSDYATLLCWLRKEKIDKPKKELGFFE